MGKVIQLVQFQNDSDLVGGHEDTISIGEIHYLVDDDDSYEYYLGENDDGDEEYDELLSISYAGSLDNVERNRFKSFTPKRKMDYITIQIEMED